MSHTCVCGPNCLVPVLVVFTLAIVREIDMCGVAMKSGEGLGAGLTDVPKLLVGRKGQRDWRWRSGWLGVVTGGAFIVVLPTKEDGVFTGRGKVL